MSQLDLVASAPFLQLAPEAVDPLVRHDEDQHGLGVRRQLLEIGDRLCVSQPRPELVLDEDPDHSGPVTYRQIRGVFAVELFFGRYPSRLERRNAGPAHKFSERLGEILRKP